MNDYLSDTYKTLNILCVEDDADTLEVYKAIFSLIFNRVYFSADGLTGLNTFKTKKIDIILTDYQMPKCDGLEMSRKIREIDASVPIIMVTALESIEMLKKALDINITSFLKKPFTKSSLFSVFNLAVKSVIADRTIMNEQAEKILYNTYQENLTFAKESLIAKNDAKESNEICGFKCEVVYKPKDILSGDSYSIREINENEYFLFIVDGMGKGVSASVTAMLSSTYVNYHINYLLENNLPFSLEELLEKLFKFIHPNLLEDEILSASFLHCNKQTQKIEYALFTMPPILYTLDNKVFKIQSNNTPIASYTNEFNVDELCSKDFKKMLIYSDGLNENSLKEFQGSYSTYLQKDFLEANDSSALEYRREKVSNIQEDDITYIFLAKNDFNTGGSQNGYS